MYLEASENLRCSYIVLYAWTISLGVINKRNNDIAIYPARCSLNKYAAIIPEASINTYVNTSFLTE